MSYVPIPSVTIDGKKYVMYRLFIDETGSLPADKHPGDEDRYLSLTGIILSVGYVREVLQQKFDDLRAHHFGHTTAAPVILHRTAIRSRIGAFAVLKDAARRKAWGDAFLDFVNEMDGTAITVTIDKRQLAKTHPTKNPYHLGVITLCERYWYFLNGRSAVGDLIAEARTPVEDERLRDAFREFRKWRSWYISNKDIQKRVTCHKLKVLPKKENVAGLQICDCLAAPGFFTALQLYKKIDFPSEYSRRISRALYMKYYKGPALTRLWSGREGFGIVWRPK